MEHTPSPDYSSSDSSIPADTPNPYLVSEEQKSHQNSGFQSRLANSNLSLGLRLPTCEYYGCDGVATGGKCKMPTGFNFCLSGCSRKLCHYHKTGKDQTIPVRQVDTITCQDCKSRVKCTRKFVYAFLVMICLALVIFLLMKLEKQVDLSDP